MTPRRAVVVGVRGDRRLAFFDAALGRFGLPPAAVVPWAAYLAGGCSLGLVLGPDVLLRVESPGGDHRTETALLAVGACGTYDGVLPGADCLEPPYDRGLIRHPRQWYLGLCRGLRQIAAAVATHRPWGVIGSPADVPVLFDKRRTQERFAAAGLPTPARLRPVGDYDDLRAAMRHAGWKRAFVKLAHGSSSSGAVALRLLPRGVQAITATEVVADGEETRLYNTLLVRSYGRESIVRRLIDTLAPEGLIVEEWLPKATRTGRNFDLRVVTIAGEPKHVVVRTSGTPLTNLHLGNRRGDWGEVKAAMGPARLERLWDDCRRAAAVFPHSLHLGLDVLLRPGLDGWAFLEANAFGDLLPGALHDGMDTYTAELAAQLGREPDQ